MLPKCQGYSFTAFTVSELLKENQQGGWGGGEVKLSPPNTQIRVDWEYHYTFRLDSVYTIDTCFGWILPLMFFIFDVQEEWTWNISNNYIIKSDMCVNLKYIRKSLDIYQHISYQTKSKKEKN